MKSMQKNQTKQCRNALLFLCKALKSYDTDVRKLVSQVEIFAHFLPNFRSFLLKNAHFSLIFTHF